MRAVLQQQRCQSAVCCCVSSPCACTDVRGGCMTAASASKPFAPWRPQVCAAAAYLSQFEALLVTHATIFDKCLLIQLAGAAAKGACVILTSRNVEAGQKVADEIKAGGAKVRSCAGLVGAWQAKQSAAVRCVCTTVQLDAEHVVPGALYCEQRKPSASSLTDQST